jgi:solute carrier family 25 (mitochondrial dicarboxylate transporter), member 10
MAFQPAHKEITRDTKIKYPFWFGGSASALAACVTHPLDLGTVIHLLHVERN